MSSSLWSAPAILVILALTLTSCTGQLDESESIPSKTQGVIPEVTIANLSISCPASVKPDTAYTTARMWFIFHIYNPDTTSITLDKFEYSVYGGEYPVAGAETAVSSDNLEISIAPSSVINVDFALPYISRDDNPSLWSEMIKGNVTWNIEGKAYVHINTESLAVPFECVVEDYHLDIDARCFKEE